MTIFDTVKGTVNTAVDTISAVAQTIVDKNRTNAKLNRLRLVMKNESELMNRAYIALGKQYYEMQKKGEAVPTENQQKLAEVIDKSKAKIAKARECYRQIVDSQNDIFYGKTEPVEYKSEDIVDITVACSNENEYSSFPFEEADTASENKVANEADNSSAESKFAEEIANKIADEISDEFANEFADISSKVDKIDEKLDDIADDIADKSGSEELSGDVVDITDEYADVFSDSADENDTASEESLEDSSEKTEEILERADEIIEDIFSNLNDAEQADEADDTEASNEELF